MQGGTRFQGDSVEDPSNGYEDIAAEFVRARSATIGVGRVREWAKALPRGAAVIDLGCGAGLPITQVLVAEKLDVCGVDASPSLVREFRRNLPGTPIACEAVQDSEFFNRSFDGALAWGLMFMLSPEDQRRLIHRVAGILAPGGRLLFTSPAEPACGTDIMTGREWRSLGADAYRRQFSAVGLSLIREFQDECEGQNHYFDVIRT